MKLRGPQWVNQGLTSSKTPRFDLSSYWIFPPPHRGCGRFVVAKFSSLVTSFCCCLPVKIQCGHSTHLRGPSLSKSFVSGWSPIESSCYHSIYFFWGGASCISLSWILFAFPSNMWTLIQEMWKQDHRTGTLAKPLFLGGKLQATNWQKHHAWPTIESLKKNIASQYLFPFITIYSICLCAYKITYVYIYIYVCVCA